MSECPILATRNLRVKSFINDNATQLIPEVKALELARIKSFPGTPDYRQFPLVYQLMELVSPNHPNDAARDAIDAVKDWVMDTWLAIYCEEYQPPPQYWTSQRRKL